MRSSFHTATPIEAKAYQAQDNKKTRERERERASKLTCKSDNWVNISMLCKCLDAIISAHMKQQTPLYQMLNLNKNIYQLHAVTILNQYQEPKYNVQTKSKILQYLNHFYHSNIVLWLAMQARESMLVDEHRERETRVMQKSKGC